jgi:hypothetical protein
MRKSYWGHGSQLFQMIWSNFSANLKPYSKRLWPMNQGRRVDSLMKEKPEGQISRETVLKGTVTRFSTFDFFIKQFLLGPWFCFEFAEICSIFECKNRACGVIDTACIFFAKHPRFANDFHFSKLFENFIVHAVSMPPHTPCIRCQSHRMQFMRCQGHRINFKNSIIFANSTLSSKRL